MNSRFKVYKVRCLPNEEGWEEVAGEMAMDEEDGGAVVVVMVP